MDLEQWLALPNDQRLELFNQWNPYEDGYWHGLLEQALARFVAEYGDHPDILRIIGLNKGSLVISVMTRLRYPETLRDLPSRFCTFPVLQTCGGDIL